MLKRVFKLLSLVISWLEAFFDTSQKLYPGRLAYKHELNILEITSYARKPRPLDGEEWHPC